MAATIRGVDYFSSGVTDGRGGYGYVIYVKRDAYERAASILGV